VSGGVALSPAVSAVCSGVSGRVYGVSRSSGDIRCQFRWYSDGGVLLRSYSRVLLTVSPLYDAGRPVVHWRSSSPQSSASGSRRRRDAVLGLLSTPTVTESSTDPPAVPPAVPTTHPPPPHNACQLWTQYFNMYL